MNRAALIFLAILASACGRTPMDDFTDGGGPPRLDGTLPPRDAEVDGEVPRCRGDAECDDGVFCNGAETCRSGSCVPGAPVLCNDGVSCTADRCVEASRACESVPDGSLCPPGQLCDPRRGCVSRPCMGDAECQDGFICNGNEVCRGGLCQAGAPLRCEDGISCTVDECSEAVGGCRSRPDHARCTDGLFCNGTERCVPEAGGCLPSMAVDCNDFDRCTIDRCDEGADRCVHTPSGDPTCVGRCPDVELGSTFGTAVATGTTVGAGNEHNGSCGGGGAPERTFRWTAPFAAAWTFDTIGSSYDTLLYLLRRCGGAELPGACDDDRGGSLTSLVTVPLAAGESVIVVVDGFGSNAGNFQLNIRDRAVMCEPAEFFCSNGIDDDCDGPIDCMDPDCFGHPDCRPPCSVNEFDCRNGLDEDCDGLFDCADPDCRFDRLCCRPSPEICNDGIDNDCDLRRDCFDFDCRLSPSCRPDGGFDGGVDGGPADGGMCTAREIGVAACTDGRDGDCDGTRDCADSDCSPFGPMWECCNGLDDDGDGQVDIFTCRCGSDADCRTVGSLEQVCWTELYSVCAPRCNFYGGTPFCRMFDPSLVCNSVTGQCVFP